MEWTMDAVRAEIDARYPELTVAEHAWQLPRHRPARWWRRSDIDVESESDVGPRHAA